MERVELPACVCEMVNIYTDVGYDVTTLPQHAWGGTVILSIFCPYGPRYGPLLGLFGSPKIIDMT